MTKKGGGRAPAGMTDDEKPAIMTAATEARGIELIHPTSHQIEVQKRPKRVRNYRRHAKKVVAETFADIMITMAAKSERGSLAHTKYLFEIGGVKEDIVRQGQGKAEPSLAELLLAHVKRQQGTRLLTAGDSPVAAGGANEAMSDTHRNEASVADGESGHD